MPKLNVSGYRGIWGKDLDEKIAFDFGRAFAKMIKEQGGHKILIGRDARKTGPQIFKAIKLALKKEGLEGEYAGIIPTPSMLLLARKLSFGGGIMITASHNPREYNGLKFINKNGLFATQKEIEKIEENRKNLIEDEKNFSQKENEEEVCDNSSYQKIHIKEVLKNIDVNLIKSKKFKVTHDPINSAGSTITKKLLEELGCEVSQINEEQNGEFAHEPEPLAKNLKQLAEAVSKNNSDIGFAQDPDADRLVLANEKGEILNEEYTLALAVKSVLSKNPSDVILNMSTSKMCEDLANNYNKKVFRTKVGEPNVVEKMIERGALIGGEGNGGVIYSKINTARDSLAGIALVLELMAREKKNISEIIESLPKYFMKKDKITFSGDLTLLYEKLKAKFKEASTNTLDGLRFDWPDSSWVHIRPSNTEPVIRIIGEAKEENRINTIFNQVRLIL
ncbi:phosphoglucosamine mutase [Patescibacteria group bacterium]|nr:phosphoglucosamine mutase [Patescibacteria group bacterium]MBU1728248.1 phosphoglucosamine mutase [Patescibacteria group bacterium]